jgi:hypothetical protein
MSIHIWIYKLNLRNLKQFKERSQNCAKQLLASSCLFVCSSVRPTDNQWTDVLEILYFDIFRKHIEKIKALLNCEHNNRYFTIGLVNMYDNISLTSSWNGKMFHTAVADNIQHTLYFMSMWPCILVYNDHKNNWRDAAVYALYLMVMLYMFRTSLSHLQDFRKLYLQPDVVFNYSWFCLLFVTWCICARFSGSWIGVR